VRLISNSGKSEQIEEDISTTIKESFSEFPRISRGLNSDGGGEEGRGRVKMLAPVRRFRILSRWNVAKTFLCLPVPDDDNDRYNLGKVLVES